MAVQGQCQQLQAKLSISLLAAQLLPEPSCSAAAVAAAAAAAAAAVQTPFTHSYWTMISICIITCCTQKPRCLTQLARDALCQMS
jgi:hypothetical protein